MNATMPAAATAAAAAPGPLTQLALTLLAVMASNIQQTSSTAGLCQHGHSGNATDPSCINLCDEDSNGS
jgi:hypothetical protein